MKRVIKKRVAKFAVGDTVVIKCGGPAMTVQYTDGDGDVVCRWFPSVPSTSDRDGRPFAAERSTVETFHEDMLHACDPLTYGETEKF